MNRFLSERGIPPRHQHKQHVTGEAARMCLRFV
jgi:hypothetical protein